MLFYKISLALVTAFYRVFFNLSVSGTENIPKDGSFVLCGNHKSNFDGPLMLFLSPRRLQVLAKYELFKNPVFAAFFKKFGLIPVKRGQNDVSAVKACMSVLKGGNGLLIFPQGTRCKTIKPEDFKAGAIMIAKKMNAPVVPFLISGDYKFRRKINVTVGKPITASDITYLLENNAEKNRDTVLAEFLSDKITTLSKEQQS